MDSKKIIKIASIIQNTLKTGDEHLVTYNSGRLTGLNNKIKDLHAQINKCLENDFEGARKSIILQINTCITKAEDFLKAAKSNINQETYVPSIEDLINEITAVKNSFPSLEFRNGELIITSDTIILQEIDFGKFKIKIDLENLKEKPDRFLKIDAVSPNYSSDGEYVHPHIDNHMLCCGEGYDILIDAARQGRIEDLFKLVLATLNTYNEGFAYCELENWEGKHCSSCGDQYDEDEAFYCTKCDSNLCGSCSYRCENCDEYFCEEHVSTPCSCCEKKYCDYCSDNHTSTCEKCDKTFCDDCSAICNECENRLCQDCLAICDHCSNEFCVKCLKSCEECKESICPGCSYECSNCNKKYCEDCYDEESCNLNKVKA